MLQDRRDPQRHIGHIYIYKYTIQYIECIISNHHSCWHPLALVPFFISAVILIDYWVITDHWSPHLRVYMSPLNPFILDEGWTILNPVNPAGSALSSSAFIMSLTVEPELIAPVQRFKEQMRSRESQRTGFFPSKIIQLCLSCPKQVFLLHGFTWLCHVLLHYALNIDLLLSCSKRSTKQWKYSEANWNTKQRRSVSNTQIILEYSRIHEKRVETVKNQGTPVPCSYSRLSWGIL